MFRKKIILTLVAVLMLLIVLGGCSSSTPIQENKSEPKEETKEQETITIGVFAPITGDWGVYGTGFERSVNMAFDEINAKGGVLGKKLVAKVMDDKGEPKEAASIAQQFANDDSIAAIVGGFSSSCCMAAMPIYERASLSVMSPTASHKDLLNSKYFFRAINSNKTEASYLANWALEEFGKTAVTFGANNDWGQDICNEFTIAFEAGGGKVLSNEPYSQDLKDFSSIITKAKSLNPDVVFLGSQFTDAALILQQSKQLGFDTTFVASNGIQDQGLIDVGGSGVNGVYTISEFFSDDPTPKAKEYLDKYDAKYGTNPGMYPALAYDCAYMVANAIEKAGSTDRNAIRDALEQTKDFEGVTGVMTVGPDHDIQKQMIKLTVKDEKFVVYNK